MKKPIRIIATTDLHGLFFDGQHTPRPAGTLAGVRDYFSKALASEPDVPKFLVDAGDFAGGGIVMWDGFYRQPDYPNVVTEELRLPLKYDAMVPGNHDLDPPIGRFISYARATRTTMVGSNTDCPGVRPYAFTWRNGVTVGFVGYVTTEAEPLDGSFKVETGSKRVAQAVAKLKDEIQPDYIVLLAHTGPEESERILSEIPEIDLAVCGHEHSTKGVYKTPDGRLIVNPGPYGLTLADIRVWKFGQFAEIVNLPRVPHPMPEWLTELGKQTLVGGSFPKNLDEHIHAVLADIGADISVITPTGVTLTEPLSVGESFALLPYDDRLVTFEINPGELSKLTKELSTEIHRTIPKGGIAKAIAPVHTYKLMGSPGKIIDISNEPLRNYILKFSGE